MSKYDGLSKTQLVALLDKHDRTKKLGLVWERDEILADNAIDENFVAATLDVGLSDKPAPWRNLVIEGDNFDSLRWLRMTYAGQIKCIYVDPPYNTGNKDWVYNDRYFDVDDRYRFSTWLEFLYRRFTLARDLLTEDGVILVSINDENRALLELMLEEALPGMRLGCFVWRTRKGGYDSGNFSKDHDFVLVYRNPKFEFAGSAKERDDYDNPDDDPRGDWTDDPLQQPKTYKQRKGGVYLIEDPDTGIFYPPNPNRVWSVGQEGDRGLSGKTIEQLKAENLIIFKRKGEFVYYDTLKELEAALVEKTAHKFARADLPNLDQWVGKKIGLGSVRIKKFLSEKSEDPNPISSLLDGITTEESFSEKVGKTSEGTRDINKLFENPVFQYPKPVSLLKALVGQSVRPGEIILDFFAGTASTAHAVMSLNAEDGGDRRFIMASSTEATEEEPDKNICRDITAERIRLLNKSDDKKYTNLATEFAYLKTREIAFDAFDDELNPQEVWSALEALHGLPLTDYEMDSPWNEHSTDVQVIIYADEINKALITNIQKHVDARANLFVYSWAPGQIEAEFPQRDFEIRSVRDTLVSRFQQ